MADVKVDFVDDIYRDLGRRDFTINAMALDLSSDGLDGERWRECGDI